MPKKRNKLRTLAQNLGMKKCELANSKGKRITYMPYTKYLIMVKTIRISNDNLHKELLKIQGEIQAKSGEFTSMDAVIQELINRYKKKSSKY